MPYRTIAPLCLILCLFPLTLFAQSATATLSGIVSDGKGGRVLGAEVRALNIATDLERKTVTNATGYFNASLLPPGTYTVMVQSDGFAQVELHNIVLNVNDTRLLTVELKPGTIAETITITDEVPLVDSSASVNTVVDRRMVENLPLNGRSFQSLISLTPGVVMVNTSNGGTGGQFSVNGQRANANAFVIDGVSANFGMTGGGFSLQGNGSVPAVSVLGGTNNLVSIDALQEFSVQTSNYAAEFGRHARRAGFTCHPFGNESVPGNALQLPAQ